MARLRRYGIAAGIVVLAALTIGVVQTRADKAPDITGTWRIDPSRSDVPTGTWGTGEWRLGTGERGRGGPGGRGERTSARRPDQRRGNRRRGPVLPPVLKITYRGGVVVFADSAGVSFQEIRIGGTVTKGGVPRNEGVRQVTGKWSDGALEIERPGRRGGGMTQKFKLADDGRTLDVRLERKGGDEGKGTRGELKMVYRKVV